MYPIKTVKFHLFYVQSSIYRLFNFSRQCNVLRVCSALMAQFVGRLLTLFYLSGGRIGSLIQRRWVQARLGHGSTSCRITPAKQYHSRNEMGLPANLLHQCRSECMCCVVLCCVVVHSSFRGSLLHLETT